VARSETLEAIAGFIADVCAVNRATVKPEGKLLAFGLDSIRLLDLIMAVEERYGLQLSESDPELASIETVRDLADLVDRRLGAAG
jgi:acyl carrier protein